MTDVFCVPARLLEVASFEPNRTAHRITHKKFRARLEFNLTRNLLHFITGNQILQAHGKCFANARCSFAAQIGKLESAKTVGSAGTERICEGLKVQVCVLNGANRLLFNPGTLTWGIGQNKEDFPRLGERLRPRRWHYPNSEANYNCHLPNISHWNRHKPRVGNTWCKYNVESFFMLR